MPVGKKAIDNWIASLSPEEKEKRFLQLVCDTSAELGLDSIDDITDYLDDNGPRAISFLEQTDEEANESANSNND